MGYKIALACDKQNCESPEVDEVVIQRILNGMGHSAELCDWQGNADWAAFDAVVIRATWNYSTKIEAFLSWCQHCDSVSQLMNPLSLVRWNYSKTYLKILEEQQINIVPTVFVNASPDFSLDLVPVEWPEFIVKAAVGAGGDQLVKLKRSAADVKANSAELNQITSSGDYMIQPFLQTVSTLGEVSLMFFDQQFSHAVQKFPAANDYRVQVEHNGRDEITEASPELIEIGLRCLATLPDHANYARIDFLFDENGQPLVNEVEVIEPSLYFQHAERRATQFVDSILNQIAHCIELKT